MSMSTTKYVVSRYKKNWNYNNNKQLRYNNVSVITSYINKKSLKSMLIKSNNVADLRIQYSIYTQTRKKANATMPLPSKGVTLSVDSTRQVLRHMQ